jgi:hypothetical protein
MKSIALAMENFHDRHDRYPVYNGIFPPPSGVPMSADLRQSAGPYSVYGSYLLHLLPYLDQQASYDSIRKEVLAKTNTGKAAGSAPGTPATPAVYGPPGAPYPAGPPSYPAVPAVYDYTGLTKVAAIPATYNQWNSTKQVQYYFEASPQSVNGAVIWIQKSKWVPNQFADPGTGIGEYWVDQNGNRASPKLVSAAIPAGPPTYPASAGGPIITPAQPAIPGRSFYSGTFKAEARGQIFSGFLCPSDPSPGSDPQAAIAGQVYSLNADGAPWSSTNYLANWNVLSVANAARGYTSPPRQKDSISDGFSNTVLLAEGYAWCDGLGRTALVAWHEGNGGMPASITGTHNFGLTYALAGNKIKVGDRPEVSVMAANGYPNPSGSPELIFEFQVRPKPLPFSSSACMGSPNCCNALTVQSGHIAGLNVALADGSVRTLRPGLSLDIWRCLLLPNDGVHIPGEW